MLVEVRRRVRKHRAVIVAAVLAAPASAIADAKWYNGAECHFGDEDYAGQVRNGPRLYNESGLTRQVVCPVAKDLEVGDVEYAAIVASASTSPASCRFRERQKDGDLVAWMSDDTDPVGSFTRIEWFDGTAFADTGAAVSFAITCDLGNTQTILMYKLTEK